MTSSARNDRVFWTSAIAVVMLVASFLIIFAVNRLQRWAQLRLPGH